MVADLKGKNKRPIYQRTLAPQVAPHHPGLRPSKERFIIGSSENFYVGAGEWQESRLR
jgi:hypothetical protein